MSRITGQQARDLLEGATSGPWEAGPSMTLSTTVAVFSHGYGPVAFVSNREGGVDEVPALTDGALAAAAPDLAETIAWLYGREADEGEGPDESKTYYGRGAWIIEADPDQGVSLAYELFSGMTPDEAVDLARALLAAAQEARNGQ